MKRKLLKFLKWSAITMLFLFCVAIGLIGAGEREKANAEWEETMAEKYGPLNFTLEEVLSDGLLDSNYIGDPIRQHSAKIVNRYRIFEYVDENGEVGSIVGKNNIIVTELLEHDYKEPKFRLENEPFEIIEYWHEPQKNRIILIVYDDDYNEHYKDHIVKVYVYFPDDLVIEPIEDE